jgi:hypothetical protein
MRYEHRGKRYGLCDLARKEYVLQQPYELREKRCELFDVAGKRKNLATIL